MEGERPYLHIYIYISTNLHIYLHIYISMHVQVSAPGLILVIWVFTLVEYRTPEYNAGQVTLTLTAIYYHPSPHTRLIRLLVTITRLLATIARLLTYYPSVCNLKYLLRAITLSPPSTPTPPGATC